MLRPRLRGANVRGRTQEKAQSIDAHDHNIQSLNDKKAAYGSGRLCVFDLLRRSELGFGWHNNRIDDVNDPIRRANVCRVDMGLVHLDVIVPIN